MRVWAVDAALAYLGRRCYSWAFGPGGASRGTDGTVQIILSSRGKDSCVSSKLFTALAALLSDTVSLQVVPPPPPGLAII